MRRGQDRERDHASEATGNHNIPAAKAIRQIAEIKAHQTAGYRCPSQNGTDLRWREMKIPKENDREKRPHHKKGGTRQKCSRKKYLHKSRKGRNLVHVGPRWDSRQQPSDSPIPITIANRGAAARNSSKRGFKFGPIGIGRVRIGLEISRRRHDLAGLAVTALRDLFRQPRLLHRVRAVG